MKRFALVIVGLVAAMAVYSSVTKSVFRSVHPATSVPSALLSSGIQPTSLPTPATIFGSSLKAWFHCDPAYAWTDAAKTTRAQPETGQSIYTLEDLAGVGDATQSVAGVRPTINVASGSNYMRIDGTAKGLNFAQRSQANPSTIYIVATILASKVHSFLWRSYTSPPYSIQPAIRSGDHRQYFSWGAETPTSSENLNLNQKYILRYRIGSGVVGFRADNGSEVTVSVTETVLTNWGGIGEPEGLYASIAPNVRIEKLCIVDGTVTAEQDAEMMAYLESHTLTGTISSDAYQIKHPVPAKKTNPAVIIYAHGSGVTQDAIDVGLHTDVVAELRKAGYMMVAANLGGENWGNDAGLDKLAAIYDYVNTTYEPSRVMFWGESMGGLVTLKALADARFSAVKGGYFTYPVCSITSMNYGGFVSLISTAYPSGFTGESPTDLAGSAFAGKRLRFTHSAADAVVSKTTNTDAMRTIIGSNAIESGLVTTTGEHGNASNFDAADFVAFFDRCR